LEIVPYEADETSNDSNEVDQMTVDAPGTSAEAFADKTIPQYNPNQMVLCGHADVNGETCGKSFISKDDLKIHIESVHNGVIYWEKPYTYDELNKTFTKDNPFYSHQNGSPYLCHRPVGDRMCGEQFKCRDSFMVHFGTHTKDQTDGAKYCEPKL